MATLEQKDTVRKLDRTRDFGTISGSTEYFYEQDGYFFDTDEKSVTQWATAEQLAKEAAMMSARNKRLAALAHKRDKDAALKRLLSEYMDKNG